MVYLSKKTSKMERQKLIEALQNEGIEAKHYLEIGLIEEKTAKRWLIRRHYFQLAKDGRSYTDIKYELSELFEISISSIEKIIYRTNKS